MTHEERMLQANGLMRPKDKQPIEEWLDYAYNALMQARAKRWGWPPKRWYQRPR